MTDVSIRRLESLLRSHRNQQCLLFVGAGFSASAERQGPAGESLPIPAGRDLVKIMQEALAEDSDDLGALSDLYETQFGEHGLYELLSKLFVARAVTLQQTTIASFDWKQIYTTNFDNVLQLCLGSEGKRFSTYTMSSHPSEVDYRTLPIVHINGFVHGTSFVNFRKELRLTNTQYYSDDFSRSHWGERFRSDLTTSPCIIFAGYSMYDLDVAIILRSFEGMEDRIFFVVQNKPSRASEQKLRHFGQVVAIGTDGLSDLLSDIQKSAAAPAPPYFSAWQRLVSPAGDQRAPRDIDITNFLMSGSINEANFASDIIGKSYKITINRTASDQITQRVDASQLAHVMIVSNIGNGKSTLLDSVAYKLVAKGHSVYRSGPHATGLLREVALFKQISGPLFLIVDNAFNNIDVIKAILTLGREDVHIITSSRTSEFELREGEVKDTFGHKIDIFSIDALDDKEVATLIEFMNNYALWGARQSQSDAQKAKYLKIDCSRELRAVILDVLNSPNIRSKIESLLHFQGDPNTESKIRSILIISQLLNLAQIQPDLGLVGEILHTDAGKVINAHEKQLRDISLVRNGRISLVLQFSLNSYCRNSSIPLTLLIQ